MTPVGMPTPPCDVRETGKARDWPLISFLELGAYPGAVPCARLHVRHVLREWGLADLSEPVELVLSELMTNALHASRSLDQMTPVRLWLLSDKDKVLILVWDACVRPVSPVQAGEELRENGRGLMLVDAISQQWSWYFTHEPDGKVVWSLCAGARA